MLSELCRHLLKWMPSWRIRGRTNEIVWLIRCWSLTGDPDLDRFNDQYASVWTLKWADLLQNSAKARLPMNSECGLCTTVIRESLRTNKPFDQFVRELITAKGSIYASGPASCFKINANSSDLAEVTAPAVSGDSTAVPKVSPPSVLKSTARQITTRFAAFFLVFNKNSQEFESVWSWGRS
ncbi:MAG: hypothetical protein R3C49_16155 [Planctomycetaceae bacterium]